MNKVVFDEVMGFFKSCSLLIIVCLQLLTEPTTTGKRLYAFKLVKLLSHREFGDILDLYVIGVYLTFYEDVFE